MAYFVGKGATISGPGISSACARSISFSGFSLDKIETTCLDEADDFKTYVPAAFVEPGEVSATIAMEGAISPPDGTIGTITLNFGTQAGGSAAGPTLTGSGFMTDLSSSEANGSSLIEYTVTFAFDGEGTPPTIS